MFASSVIRLHTAPFVILFNVRYMMCYVRASVIRHVVSTGRYLRCSCLIAVDELGSGVTLGDSANLADPLGYRRLCYRSSLGDHILLPSHSTYLLSFPLSVT